MAVKKTIAIVGATDEAGIQLANQFASTSYRLLLVAEEKEQLESALQQISETYPKADVESTACLKDGCWEADIIILAVADQDKKIVANMVKEVATQKLVVVISNESCNKEDLENTIIKQELPYSKLAVVILKPNLQYSIQGNISEANKEVNQLFKDAGFHLMESK